MALPSEVQAPPAVGWASDASLFDWYRDLRVDEPVHYDNERDVWVLTRDADCRQALRNTDVFSSALGPGLTHPDEAPPRVKEALKGGYALVGTLDTSDGSTHARSRAIVNGALTNERVQELAGLIADISHTLLDNFAEKESADAVSGFAYPLPVRVIAHILGVSSDRQHDFKAWSDATVELLDGNLDEDRWVECTERVVELQHFFATEIEARAKRPKDDFIGDLVRHGQQADDEVSIEEMITILQQILVGGNETTTNLIANTLFVLLSDRELLHNVRDHRIVLADLIEEVLRMEAPVQGLFRVTTQEVVVGDARIPSGSKVFIAFGSANRDRRRWEEPDRFRPGRPQRKAHLSFGFGPHICPGAGLARLETEIAVRTIIERFPCATIAQDFDWIASYIFHGPLKLFIAPGRDTRVA